MFFYSYLNVTATKDLRNISRRIPRDVMFQVALPSLQPEKSQFRLRTCSTPWHRGQPVDPTTLLLRVVPALHGGGWELP